MRYLFWIVEAFLPHHSKISFRQIFFSDTTQKETKINECCVQCNGLSCFLLSKHDTSLRQVKWPLKFHFSLFTYSIFEFALVLNYCCCFLTTKKEGRENNIVVNAVKEKAIECDSLRSNTVISIRQTWVLFKKKSCDL